MNLETERSKPELKYSLGAGEHKIDGFLTVDIDASLNPDEIMDVRKLSFKEDTVDVLYASHVLEHLWDDSYKSSRWQFIRQTLSGWRKCLKPTGKMYVCVPNFGALSKIIESHSDIPTVQQSALDAVYGGGRNKFDHHFSGFTFSLLKDLLLSAGFKSVEEFKPFVNDESTHTISGHAISLNLVAYNGTQDSEDGEIPIQEFLSHNEQKAPQSDLELYKKSSEERMAEIVALKRVTTTLREQLATKEGEIDALSDALTELRGTRTLLNAEISRLREMLADEKGLVKPAKNRPLWKKFVRWAISK